MNRSSLERASSGAGGRIRIVHLSDTHLGFDMPVRPRTEKARRGEDFFANTQRALDYAQEVCADLVIHTGDVFFRSRVPGAIVDRAYEMFTRAVMTGPPIVIVPGNHERSRMPPSLLLANPRIHVLERARAVRFRLGDRHRGATVEVVGFPYHPRAGVELDELLDEAEMRPADFRILAVHQALEGAKVGPGTFTFSRRDDDVIRKGSVPSSIDLVLAGHVHRRQVLQLGRGSEDVLGVHVGSIERTSFAEAPETKGFYDLRIQPRSEASVSTEPSASARVDLNFIPLPARPMVDLDLTSVDSTAQARAWAGRAIEEAPDRAVLRVRVHQGLLGQLTSTELRTVACLSGKEDTIVEVLPGGGRRAY